MFAEQIGLPIPAVPVRLASGARAVSSATIAPALPARAHDADPSGLTLP